MTVVDVSEELSALAQHNLKLLETGNYHDFVIKCGDRQFKVHRNIVCPQSFLLTSLCDPTWKEGSEGCAELKEQDPDIFEKALRFLYAGRYDSYCWCDHKASEPEPLPDSKEPDNIDSPLLTDIRVYILADYLDVGCLKSQALAKCTHRLTVHFHPEKSLVPISVALANTKADDKGLRQQILRSCVQAFTRIASIPELEQLLQEQEPLAWSLLVEAHQDRSKLEQQVRASQLEAKHAQTDLQHRVEEIQRAEENIRAAVKLLSTTKQCRNQSCGKEFGANLETYANGYIKGLRCKRCHCRHSIT